MTDQDTNETSLDTTTTTEASEAPAPAAEGGSSTEAVGSGSTDDLSIADKISKAVATSKAAAATVTPSAQAATAAPTVPVYTPNLTYRSMGKEAQFDPRVAAAIKTPEDEKYFRDLYSKAAGLDHAKSEVQRHAEARQMAEKTVTQFNKHLESGDLESAFQLAKIPDEMILRYALKKVKEMDDPQAREVNQRQREESQRIREMQEENQLLKQQWQETSVRQRTWEMDSVLAKPEVSAVAKALDERTGVQGYFKKEMIRLGQYYASVHGQDVPPETIAEELVRLVGPLPAAAPQVSPQPGVDALAQSVEKQKTKPVIPNIQARAASPAKKVINSIDDIRRLGQELQAAE